MNSVAESYIGAKIVYGDEDCANICSIDSFYQDDGGKEDFYLHLKDENGNWFGEIHIDDYLAGIVTETNYEFSYIIWLDENNQIDKDYFQLARDIDQKNADEFDNIEIQKIGKTYEKAIKENG